MSKGLAVFSGLLLASCGSQDFDVDDATDREAMKVEIRNALNRLDCPQAVSLSTRLYESRYSDNGVRMLYASAMGCVAGIRVLENVDEFSSFGGMNVIGQFARIYPSTLGDRRLESMWLAQDALFANLNPGVVIGPSDQVNSSTPNAGSVLVSDRTLDSSVYFLFVAMATIGNTLDRYGDPDPSYNQGADLPWTTRALVQGDLTGSACGLASGFMNFFDSFEAVSDLLPSSAASSMDTFINDIKGHLLNLGGNTACLADGNPQSVCDQARIRLRFRKACSEQASAAAFAAGMIQAVNGLWQD